MYFVPEVATLLVNGGLQWGDVSDPQMVFDAQLHLIRTQMHLEDTFVSLARSFGQKAIVLCDRGVMDSTCFITAELFEEMKSSQHWTDSFLRDERYDCTR